MSTLGIHNRWGKGNNHNILCDHEPVLALHGLQVIKLSQVLEPLEILKYWQVVSLIPTFVIWSSKLDGFVKSPTAARQARGPEHS